jgi:chemotaxis protein CheC
MTPDPPPLAARELDVLQELASIGCGHALTALGKLLRVRVDMDVPEAWVGRQAGAIADFLGTLAAELVAVGLRLDGLLAGHLVLALTEGDARRLSRRLGQAVAEEGPWSPLAESALMESGNIVGSAFVSAIAAMVGEKLIPSVPTLVRGSGRVCIDQLVERDLGTMALATRFSTAGVDGLEGLILVVPEARHVPELLAALDFA